MFSIKPLATGLSVPVRSEFELCAFSVRCTQTQRCEMSMMLNRRRRCFQSSRVELPLVNKSTGWFFGVTILDLDFGVQVDSVKQPIRRDSVLSGNVSHRRTSTFNDHLDHCWIVLKFVTCSCPFCDSSCEFVCRPKNVRSTKACQIQAFQDDLRADFGQLSDRVEFFLFEVMVVKAWSRDLFEHFAVFVTETFIRFTFA